MKRRLNVGQCDLEVALAWCTSELGYYFDLETGEVRNTLEELWEEMGDEHEDQAASLEELLQGIEPIT